MRSHISYFLFALFTVSLVSSCSTAKFVNEDQKLLDGNKITFLSEPEVKDKFLFKLELESFYQQVPNGHLFWVIPREYFYFRNSAPGDTSWYNNWARNSLGEVPIIFDKEKTDKTATSMQQFLRNNKGFYEAEVNAAIREKGHKTNVDYRIDPGTRYKISNIEFIGNDENIVKILEEIHLEEPVLKIGDPIDATTFYDAKARLIQGLQNRGFANFTSSFLVINGDSTRLENKVDLIFQVLPPIQDSIHRQYKVGNINIYTDYYNGQSERVLTSDTIQSLNFKKQSSSFLINPSLLEQKIYLKPGELWSIDDRNKTFRKLSALETYRFVSISPALSQSQDSLIDYNIYLTPHTSKYISDQGIDINYSSVNTPTGRQLFGINGTAQFRVRNIFKGAESYSLSIENGFEFNLDTLRVSTFNLGLNNNLSIPKYVAVPGIVSIFNNLGIISSDRYADFKEEATTNLAAGINYLNIRNFYTINSINGALSYDYRPNNRLRIGLRQVEFALNSFDLKPSFLNLFEDNQLLLNSFRDNFITGYLFNELSFAYTSLPSPSGKSHALLGSFEVSGLETHLANKAYNLIAGSDKIWMFSDSIDFAKFVRLEIDSRFYRQVSENTSLAFRFSGGLAVPFGEQTAVPFIRQFSVGGPNSLRAWNQKELGPGGFSDLILNPRTNQAFFQQGDIKIELNAEYRFDVLWLLEGALFVDAGNVWTLRDDPGRENSQFGRNFLSQFAIAAGWGMRWDFEYFNIRFDFAYKVRNPFRSETTGRYWYSWNEIKAQRFGNLQVAVNYPF